jgi:flagellar basal-body rod protein FlgG
MVKLIVAQRAYEINSKSIQTADEMLNTANNLKR